MNITEIRELNAIKLASGSDVTAAEHREVNNAIIDFLQTLLPLASGTASIGDTGTDSIFTVTFPDVGTVNYRVFGGLKYGGTNFNTSNDVIAMTGEYTRTSFKIALREVSPNIQNLTYEWEIKLKN